MKTEFNFKEVEQWFSVHESVTTMNGGHFIFGYRKGGDKYTSYAFATSATIPNISSAFGFDALIGLESSDNDIVAIMNITKFTSVDEWRKGIDNLLGEKTTKNAYKHDLKDCLYVFHKGLTEMNQLLVNMLQGNEVYNAFNKLQGLFTKLNATVALSMKDVARWSSKWDVSLNFKLLTDRPGASRRYVLPRVITIPIFSDQKGIIFNLAFRKPRLLEIKALRIKYTALALYGASIGLPLDKLTYIEEWLEVMETYNLSEYAKMPVTALDTRQKWVALMMDLFSKALAKYQLQPDMNTETAARYMTLCVAQIAIIHSIHVSAIQEGETEAGAPLNRENIQINIPFDKECHRSREVAWTEHWTNEYAKIGYPTEAIEGAGDKQFYTMIDFQAKDLTGIIDVKVMLDEVVANVNKPELTHIKVQHVDVKADNYYWQDQDGKWYEYIKSRVTTFGRIIPADHRVACVTAFADIDNLINLVMRKDSFGEHEFKVDMMLPGLEYTKVFTDLGIKKGMIGLGKLPIYKGRVLPFYGVHYEYPQILKMNGVVVKK